MAAFVNYEYIRLCEYTLIQFENVIKLFIRGKVGFLGQTSLTLAGTMLANS